MLACCLNTCQTHPQRTPQRGGGPKAAPTLCRRPQDPSLCGWVWQVFKHQAASSKQASGIKQQASSTKQASSIKKLGSETLARNSEILLYRLSVSYRKFSSLMKGCSSQATCARSKALSQKFLNGNAQTTVLKSNFLSEKGNAKI